MKPEYIKHMKYTLLNGEVYYIPIIQTDGQSQHDAETQEGYVVKYGELAND